MNDFEKYPKIGTGPTPNGGGGGFLVLLFIGVPLLIFTGIRNVIGWAVENPSDAALVASAIAVASWAIVLLRKALTRQPTHWSKTGRRES